MKKKIFIYLLLAAYLFAGAGCSYEVFHRKFVRKKKKQGSALPVCSVEDFAKPLNSEIYNRAFLFWKTHQEQLLIALSPQTYPYQVNNLKVRDCLKHAVSNLETMKTCLEQNKREELDIYLKESIQYKKLFEEKILSWPSLVRIRHDLERIKRNVAIRFCPGAVKNDLAAELVKTKNTKNPKK